MCLSSPLSDPHQAIAFSTNPSSSRAIGFSCSKHFAVLEILISRFSFPHHRYPERVSISPIVRCPRNLAIAFRLISRFVTKSTENGRELWNLCKQVGAVRTVTTFICFWYSGPAPSPSLCI